MLNNHCCPEIKGDILDALSSLEGGGSVSSRAIVEKFRTISKSQISNEALISIIHGARLIRLEAKLVGDGECCFSIDNSQLNDALSAGI